MNPYQKLQQRKRKWSPVQTTAGKLNEGAEEAIFRALAMRHMELPVGEFIEASLSEIPVRYLPCSCYASYGTTCR